MSKDTSHQLPGNDDTPSIDAKAKGDNKKNDSAGKKKRKGKYPLWKNVLAMVLVLCLFVGGGYWGTIKYTRHGEEIGVPPLKGLTVEQAQERLEALGLWGEVRDSIYTNETALGLVCKQSMGAGNKVKQGRIIYLTINSDRSETLILPDVVENSSFREAVAKLKALGFTLTSPEYIDGERDWVYSVKCDGRNISAGTKVNIKDPVTLVVGNGRNMMDEIELFDEYGLDSLGIDMDMFMDDVPLEIF